MGTHPIFESDFDCLTDMNKASGFFSRIPTGVKAAIGVGTFSGACFIISDYTERSRIASQAEMFIRRSDIDKAKFPGMTIGRAIEESNTKCYMDIQIGKQEPQRIEITLFDSVVPITCENFRVLCRNECRPKVSTGRASKVRGFTLNEAKFFRIEPGFLTQCGMQPVDNNASQKYNIYGGPWADEYFVFDHCEKGLLSMANKGPDTNGSQFFITLADDCNRLNGRHVVFGKVTKGLEVIDSFEDYARPGAGHRSQGNTTLPILVVGSGQIETESHETK